jgi:hypothetical protein
MIEIRAKNPNPETEREPPSDPRKPRENPERVTRRDPPSGPGDKK